MRKGAERVLRAASRAKGALDDGEIEELHADARDMTQAEFVGVWRAIKVDVRRVDEAETAAKRIYRDVNAARRRMPMPVPQFISVLIERLETDLGETLNLAAADTRSLKRAVAALTGRIDAEIVVATAKIIARENSLAYASI